MRIAVIGGTGHIGTYLCPRLVEAGHRVLSISRSLREPYAPHPAWHDVQRVTMDRVGEEQAGTFGAAIKALKSDVVIDLTCYTVDSARHLVQALAGDVQHFLHCGTIWIHGPGCEVPTSEQDSRAPISDYGRRKLEIEEYLLAEARRNRFPATILHPGHLVGQGWVPLNPAANFNSRVFSDLAQGREITLPNLGMETVHHVHADDVAQAFLRAVSCWSASVGESFHVVSPAAVTLRGYAEAVANWFGRAAHIRCVPWEEWKQSVNEQDAGITWDHIARSPNCSIAKAQRLLGYQPRYRSLEAIREAVQWLVASGVIEA